MCVVSVVVLLMIVGVRLLVFNVLLKVSWGVVVFSGLCMWMVCVVVDEKLLVLMVVMCSLMRFGVLGVRCMWFRLFKVMGI